MTRGIGAADLAHGLPEWAVVLLGLLTQLGDAWFVALLLACTYVLVTDRRPGVATVAGATLLGIGLYRTLKHLFDLPRPPDPLASTVDPGGLAGVVVDLTATAGGYGFPSGHATTAAALYVGLAAVLPYGSRRSRYAGAAVLVVTVSATRVLLGLHHVVDVVAGTALGLSVVGGSLWLARRRGPTDPTPVFAAAVGVAVAYVLASGAELEALVLLGLAVAALAAWTLELGTRATDVLPLDQ